MTMCKLTKSEKLRLKLNINSKDDAVQYIGKKCKKLSGKPFKSHLWENTISGVDVIKGNDGKEKIAFSFLEDDSLVSCQMVYINPLKRRMSELKPEVLEVLYALRLSDHKDIPYDEYIKFFNFIVVDDVVYCTDDESTEKRVSTYFKAREGNEMCLFSLTFPDVIIKNRSVIKNRYGKSL